MQNFPFDDLLTEAEVDNEIDELFSQLEHFDAPVGMVEDIMRAISQLPPFQPLSTWNAFDFFEVEFDEAQLC